MGWRYLLFSLGGVTILLWALRFFLFNLEESPRFLVGLGRDEEAVAVLHRIAAYNGKTCSLTVGQLVAAGEEALQRTGSTRQETKTRHVLSRSSNYSIDHIKALFKTRRMAWSTTLLISLWGKIHTVTGCGSAVTELSYDRYYWPCFNSIQQLLALPASQSWRSVR